MTRYAKLNSSFGDPNTQFVQNIIFQNTARTGGSTKSFNKAKLPVYQEA